MTELEYLKKELEESSEIASFTLLYDRKNKKFLALHNCSEELAEKMLRKAISTNGFFETVIRKTLGLSNERNIDSSDVGFKSKDDFFDFLRGFKQK